MASIIEMFCDASHPVSMGEEGRVPLLGGGGGREGAGLWRRSRRFCLPVALKHLGESAVITHRATLRVST